MSALLLNSLVTLLAAACIFLFGGILIGATNRIAKRLHSRSFLVAFVLLGILTSFSEISVAINATIEGVPQVSAGNLVGASFVIFLLIIPLLAIFGDGIRLQNSLTKKNLLLALFVIGSPAFFVFDGVLTRSEGVVMILLYILLLYYTKKSPPLSKVTQAIQQATYSRKKLTTDVSKVVLAAIVIFMSGKLLVHEAIFFSILLGIPASLIGLLIIAVGTNIPELVIAIRAVRQKNKGVAFGDYLGSAAFNTIILGVLVVMNGQFMIDRSEFLLISWFLVSGLFFFYLFSRSRYDISRSEGIALSLVYVAFVIVQLLSVAGMPNAH